MKEVYLMNDGSEVGRNVEFILRDDIDDLRDCTLVTGFYGIGKCGFITINHMVQVLGAKRIGFILSDYLPPFLSVKDERLILPFEIYKYENIIFVSAFFEPYKNEHRLFAHGLIRWAISRELARVVVIGGLDSRLRTNEDVFAKCVYSAAYNDLFPNPQIPMMDEGLFITGPMALVLMYAEINNFPALGILPYAERSRPDPIGASHAVEILNDLLGTECGVQDLVREAENIENELQSIEGVLQEEAEDQDDRDKGMFM